jgi:UDP-N-acetylglucosamine 1-carboxyvinyltransferase
MGANIVGAGTDVIKVKGVRTLAGSVHSVIPDQIEAGTYMVAAAITKGDVTVSNVIPKHLEFITMKLREMGYSVTEFDDSVRVTVPELFDSRKPNAALQNIKIQTQPHPGFPTDMHPQFASLIASDVRYTGAITETIFDSRFSYVNELLRMGIRISVDGKTANINGVSKLNAARVKSTDLRAGAALIVAGLAADGTTVITETHHIERGYERIDEKLRKLGGNVWFSYENKTEEIDPISDDNVAVATAN